MDQYRWFVQYLTPGPVVSKDWWEREKMTKELISLELLRINSLVVSRKEVLFYRQLATFFMGLNIRLDTIPPMVYSMLVSVLHQWLNTQILLAVDQGVPAMRRGWGATACLADICPADHRSSLPSGTESRLWCQV